MSDARNQLVLCALRRAAGPATSEDVLDAAFGLAESAGWTPAQLADLNRRSVAKRLALLVESGEVVSRGTATDPRARRPTPLFAVDDPDPHAPVPDPPVPARDRLADPESPDPYAGMTREQLVAICRAHNELTVLTANYIERLMAKLPTLRAELSRLGLETQR